MSSSDWCTIESDPGVFTELIEKIGVKGIQVEELYTLEEEEFEQVKPVYGLIFLFKWRPEEPQQPTADFYDPELFFANQVITNACATQAILSILLNCSAPEVDIGKELREFKEFTRDFSSEMRGLAISNSELIKNTHNSFARPEPFSLEKVAASKDDDVYHFISYVPINGKLYELDGLKPRPVCLGEIQGRPEDWITEAKPHIQQRIQKYSENEIRFNLMALIRNRVDLYRDQISTLQEQLDAGGDEIDEETKQVLEKEIRQAKTNIRNEEIKRKRWHEENVRRRHNYVPFLVNLLKILAEKGELRPLIDQAKQKQQEREQQQQDQQQDQYQK